LWWSGASLPPSPPRSSHPPDWGVIPPGQRGLATPDPRQRPGRVRVGQRPHRCRLTGGWGHQAGSCGATAEPPSSNPTPRRGLLGRPKAGWGSNYGEIRVGGGVRGGRSRASRKATRGADRPDWVVVGAGSAGTPPSPARSIPTATASPHTPSTPPHRLDRRSLIPICGRVGLDASAWPPPQQPARMARFQPPPRQESPPTIPRGPGITCRICGPKTQNASIK
jgi:hypothetical protein